jgi:hypothetical protein
MACRLNLSGARGRGGRHRRDQPSIERALAEAKAQRDRELVADKIEAMAAAIAQAAPGFNAGAAALLQAVTKSSASIPEATSFATSVDAMRREVLSAADLICWELRTAAVLTRAGNANIAFPAPLINRVVFHRVIALARAN